MVRSAARVRRGRGDRRARGVDQAHRGGRQRVGAQRGVQRDAHGGPDADARGVDRGRHVLDPGDAAACPGEVAAHDLDDGCAVDVGVQDDDLLAAVAVEVDGSTVCAGVDGEYPTQPVRRVVGARASRRAAGRRPGSSCHPVRTPTTSVRPSSFASVSASPLPAESAVRRSMPPSARCTPTTSPRVVRLTASARPSPVTSPIRTSAAAGRPDGS